MNFKKAKNLFLVIPVILVSCYNKSLTPDEYILWVQEKDNGIYSTVESNDFLFELQYQPAEYLLLQRHPYNLLSKSNLDSLLKEMRTIQHYTLTVRTTNNTSIENAGVSTQEEKQRRLYYLSYLFQNDLVLIEGDKKSPCVLYHFEKGSNPSASRKFLLGFETTPEESLAATLRISSQEFGSLPINITISKANIPSLKL